MISLGIIGTGGMANSHAQQYMKMKGVRMVACCDVVEDRVRQFAEKYGIPRWYTDYQRMLDEVTLDGLDNVTVDAAHAPVSLAAIAHGVPVFCEKPLATSLADARAMRNAARRRKLITMVNFSYRNSSGAQAAAAWVASGGIGRVMHLEASYLQSWLAQSAWGDWRKDVPLTWRLSKRHGSAGTLGDIGCHIYDLATLIAGDIGSIECRLETFDKGIKGNRIGPYVLDANDSFVSNVRLASGGGLGVVHATRWGTGHMNSLRVRVFGDEGAVMVDLDRSYDRYWVVKGRRAMEKADWREVKAKPTPNQYQRFVKSLRTGENDVCDFGVGLKVQAYLDASIRSDREGKPIAIKG